MKIVSLLRQWIAKPFVEAETARCTVLVEEFAVKCQVELSLRSAAIAQQAFAEGQQFEHERVFDMIDDYIAERDGKEVCSDDIDRLRAAHRQ